ncbi:hypothetical protein TrispH2_007131 [Trichoplax sp. H2]|nr:hypothetical protein TrispH2_007131 [Trichoplax sp. H2]|eukprot:RDD40178.1 hypothetical protein TrispH2_007131 [Trichoplax sp. H2]
MSTTYSNPTNNFTKSNPGNEFRSEGASPTGSRYANRANESMIRNKGEKTGSVYRSMATRTPGSRSSRTPTPMKTLSETAEEKTDKDEGSWNTKGSDSNVFNTLCDSVMTGNGLLHSSVTELLDIKDELIKHSLPPSLLLRILLTTSRLFRSVADLNIPLNELVRLVRMYSVPWEEKSEALKKLHADYDSKLRQLNVALRKLELVAVHAERMQKEQSIMHWERMYIKTMVKLDISTLLKDWTASGRSRRWKFLIPSFKKKIEQGVDVYNYYADPNDDEEVNMADRQDRLTSSLDEKITIDPGRSITLKIQTDTSEMDRPESQVIRPSSRQSAQSADSEKKADSVISEGFEHDLLTKFKNSRMSGLDLSSADGMDTMQRTSSSFDLITDPTTDLKAACVPMEDAGTWTHEREFEKYMHIKLYKPVGFKDRSFSCHLQIRGNSFKSRTYEREPTHDSNSFNDKKRNRGSLVGSKIATSSIIREKRKILLDRNTLAGLDINDYEEFIVHIPHDPNKKDIDTDKVEENNPDDQLSIAIHDAVSRGIIAVATIDMDDLKILTIDEGEVSEDDEKEADKRKDKPTHDAKPTLFPLYSTHQTGINSPPQVGQLPLACYWEYCEIFKHRNQSTETLPFYEMVKEVTGFDIEEERKKIASYELERVASKAEMNRLKAQYMEDMEHVQSDYAKRFETMTTSLKRAEAAKKKAEIQAATRQVKLRSPVDPLPPPKSPTNPRKYEKIRLKVDESPNPAYSKLPENLPTDFFERMDHFTQENKQKQEEYRLRTREEVRRMYEERLASQFLLAKESEEEIAAADVCLPALFMPTQLGHVYNPRAHLYFNPSGSRESRITQPPSMPNYKLPEIPKTRHLPIVNLFEISQSMANEDWAWANSREYWEYSTTEENTDFATSPSKQSQGQTLTAESSSHNDSTSLTE